jgi:hypothetical protein
MPHGDFSDFAALALIFGGLQQIFMPQMSFEEVGPFKASFNAASKTPEVSVRSTFG